MNGNGGYQILRQIGLRIKQLRTDKVLSQQDLAQLCGISKSGMSRIEAGQINMSMRTLLCIVEAFGISMEEFFDGLD